MVDFEQVNTVNRNLYLTKLKKSNQIILKKTLFTIVLTLRTLLSERSIFIPVKNDEIIKSTVNLALIFIML